MVAAPQASKSVPVAIIIPTFNEAGTIIATLEPLQSLRAQGVELHLADGGSTDATCAMAAAWVDNIMVSAPGRGLQMNTAAFACSAQWLLFIHADTLVHDAALVNTLLNTVHDWGFFTLRLSGKRRCFRLIERAINWRSRLTHIATGDQCLFVRRQTFMAINGYPHRYLMEDLGLCDRLRALGPPLILPQTAITASRRWESKGVIRTVLTMWLLRFAYRLGAKPHWLAKHYYPHLKSSIVEQP